MNIAEVLMHLGKWCRRYSNDFGITMNEKQFIINVNDENIDEIEVHIMNGVE